MTAHTSLFRFGRLAVVNYFAAASSDNILRYPIKHKKSPLNVQKQAINEDFLDDMYRGRGVHYVDLFVGCPPQQQSVNVNTGSDDTGIPCAGRCRGNLEKSSQDSGDYQLRFA